MNNVDTQLKKCPVCGDLRVAAEFKPRFGAYSSTEEVFCDLCYEEQRDRRYGDDD